MMKYELMEKDFFELMEDFGDRCESDEYYEALQERVDSAIEKIWEAIPDTQAVKYERFGDWFKGVRTLGISHGVDIDYYWDILNIKDGVNYVRFEDGSFGIIAYYSGMTDVLRVSVISENEYHELEEEDF